MSDGDCAAFGASDGEAEEVAEASDVAAGGEGLVEDAVLSQLLWGEAEGGADPASADGTGPDRRVEVDEQVGVGGVRPASSTFVEPGANTVAHWLGDDDDRAGGQEHAAVADVGELQVPQLRVAQAWNAISVLRARLGRPDVSDVFARDLAQRLLTGRVPGVPRGKHNRHVGADPPVSRAVVVCGPGERGDRRDRTVDVGSSSSRKPPR